MTDIGFMGQILLLSQYKQGVTQLGANLHFHWFNSKSEPCAKEGELHTCSKKKPPSHSL